jgi:5-methylcytosine-specific restriction endonuclease McrA
VMDYAKVAGTFWTDHNGRQWIEPQIKGRLKMRVPAHAALRAFIIQRAGGQCEGCGSTARLVADHVVSRRNGGRHHPDNMQCLCESCNASKASRVDAKGPTNA